MAKEEKKVEEAVEVKEEKKEEKKKTVMIHLIPSEWDNQEFEVFGIREKTYQINTGEDVEVPWELAESIANIVAAKKEAAKNARGGGKKR